MTKTQRNTRIGLAILLIFVVSTNIAWLNPWPEKESFRGIESVPLFWQYNKAAGVEILSAAYFPETFRTYTDRINRPTYPLAVYLLGNAVGIVASPVVDLSPLERAGAGYIVLKLLVFVLGSLAMYSVLVRWLRAEVALFAVLAVLFHAHSIEFITAFQTTELQVFTPVFVIWFMLRVVDRLEADRALTDRPANRLGEGPSGPDSADEYPAPAAGGARRRGSRRRVQTLISLVGASLIVGVLMLAKQNYAAYLTVLLFAAYKRRFLEAGLSFVVHLLPLGLYLLFLRAVDIPYVNHEAANYDQGVWMVELLRQNPIRSFTQILDSLTRSLSHLVAFFSVWFVAAVVALPFRKEIGLTRDHLLFVALLFFTTWLQIFAAVRYIDYMISDVAIVVFGLGAWALRRWVDTRDISWSFVSRIALVFWFAANVLSFVNFPWVHPFDQPARRTDVLENRLEMVENPETFSDEDRERARGGVIVDPGQQEESE